jgi:hypothetical protein
MPLMITSNDKSSSEESKDMGFAVFLPAAIGIPLLITPLALPISIAYIGAAVRYYWARGEGKNPDEALKDAKIGQSLLTGTLGAGLTGAVKNAK